MTPDRRMARELHNELGQNGDRRLRDAGKRFALTEPEIVVRQERRN
jgi:hypothetical protein